jgi:PAS domain S-box-containing protein
MNAEAEVKYLSTEEDAILRSSKFLIITTDVNGIISRFNKEAELALGFKASELIGNASPLIFHDLKEIASVANELSIDPGLQVFIHKAKLGLHEERQWTYIRKDKTTFPVKLSVTALRDAKEAFCGYLAIAINISSEIKAKEELDFERSKSMHNAKLASLGEMSAGIAHEINNPLTIIQGTISTLSGLRQNEEKFSAKIVTLTKSVDRITKIVKKLKNFSHKADNSEFSYSTASEIIQESISLVEHKAKMFATSIEIEISTDQKIYCNIVEIEQVIINLLNNAIDAIQDLEDKWIKIHLFQDGSNVIVNIIDSGNGISPELESKLFTPFFTTKKIGEGTGLGLSIVQEIIDRHKGSIKINRKFKNTCFEIIFPMTSA